MDPLAPIAIDHLRKEITHAAEVGAIWAKLRADLEGLHGRKVSEWTMSHAAVHDAIIELDGELMEEPPRYFSNGAMEDELADDYHDFHYVTICRACGLEANSPLASVV